MSSFKELAETIRHQVDFDHASKVHPDQQHLHAAALGVAAELGMDPNYFNVGHLTQLLSQHVTAPSREYPKMKYHHDKKVEHVVENATEEKELGDEWSDHRWKEDK